VLSGPFEVLGAWAAPRVAVSPGAVPFRPARGVYVVVGPSLDGERLVDLPAVAGAWQFGDGARTLTVAFVDGDLWHVAEAFGPLCAPAGSELEWAGPLERVDAFRWDWFATLTPQ